MQLLAEACCFRSHRRLLTAVEDLAWKLDSLAVLRRSRHRDERLNLTQRAVVPELDPISCATGYGTAPWAYVRLIVSYLGSWQRCKWTS